MRGAFGAGRGAFGAGRSAFGAGSGAFGVVRSAFGAVRRWWREEEGQTRRSAPLWWLVGLGGVWGYAVFQYGGVAGTDRRMVLLALGVLGAAWWAVNRRRMCAMPRAAGWCAVLLPAYAGLQLVPLPRALLGVISPARAELMRGLDAVGAGSGWGTIHIIPGTGMNHFLLLCGYGVVFFLAYQMTAGWGGGRWAMMLPVGVVAVLEGALGIAQAVGGQVASGTYANRDHYAGLLEMALPFALAYPLGVWRGLDTRREFPLRPAVRMCVSLGAAGVMAAGTLASLSRMGFFAPLFGVMVMGIVAWRGNGWRSVGLAAGLLGVLGGCFVFLPSDQLIERFAAAPEELSAEGRLQLWKESADLVRAYPVFGCGLGGYESGFLRYKVTVPMVSDDHAHNDYLQFLIELGVVGFGMGAALMGVVAAGTWRGAARGVEPGRRWLALGCIGAMAAMGMHSVVDFNLYIPANAMLLAWICGVGLAAGEGCRW